MEANELRIGNYVHQDDYSGEDFIVKSISDHETDDGDYSVNCYGGKNGTWINHISLIVPIPLSLEWLLKFNFEKADSFMGTVFGRNNVVVPHHLKHVYFKDAIVENIKYVHQLQNLYFAVTGEELQVNK